MRISRRQDVDMTQGSITRHILTFAFPLLLGNLFQQFYNLVDTFVVGNFATNEAYAAVGSVGPIINIFIGLFSGFATGAGVVISQYFGAHRMEDVKKAVHTAAVLTLVLCPIFTLLGLVLTPCMLQWNNTPENVFPESLTYLRIYFWGISGLLVYNMGSGILRAVGDSRRPFYYLVVCTVMNVALDLLLVIRFDMGVRGVALATAVSQCVSGLLVVIQLLRTRSCVRVSLPSLRFTPAFAGQIVKVGIPTGLQMAVTAFSNVFVQSYINFFGDNIMSAWTTYAKVDAILFLPSQSIAMSVTTFVGQNLGSGQVDRAKAGVKRGLAACLIITVVLMCPVMLLAPSIVQVFNKTPAVVEYGALLLRIITPFYLVNCFNHVYSAGLRGAGNTRAPMIIMLSSFVAFRQVYMFIISRVCNELIPIAMGYPAGWILCTTITTIYYYRTKLDATRLTSQK